MKKRILLAGLLGGLTLFAWGAVSHMVFQLEESAMSAAPPPPGDRQIMDAVSATFPEDGIFMLPGGDMSMKSDEAAMEEWDARWRKGPRGILAVDHGDARTFPVMLLGEVLWDVVLATVAAILLACASASCCAWWCRTLFVTGLGLIASFRTMQHWNWFHFPCGYTTVQVVDALIGFTLMGLVLAAIVRKPGACAIPPAEGVAG
jgi:hypothetical protein